MGSDDIRDEVAVRLLPRVALIAYGESPELIESCKNQDYAKTTTYHNPVDDTISKPEFWNLALQQHRDEENIVIFLDDNNVLADNTVVTQIVEKFLEDDMLPAAIYSDSIRLANGFQMNEYLPAFNAQAVTDGKLGINNPLAIQVKALPLNPFNEKIENLHYLCVLRKLAVASIVTHIAKPLFHIRRHAFDPKNDIQHLND